MAKAVKKETMSVEEKLSALYQLQKIDSQIDRIRIIQGELPLEVRDLEDEIEGLETRIGKLDEEVKELDSEIASKKVGIQESEAHIIKYKEQQNNVRNNREYDSLTKEIEFQELEIKLCDKRIKEFKAQIASKKELVDTAKSNLEGRRIDLDTKKKELDEIVSENEKDEKSFTKKSDAAKGKIDDRLLSAYQRIRDNARNGLGVVNVERDSCGGCFSKIPPQRQMDIKSHRKVIVCENCGRILVDFEVKEEAEA